MVLRKVYTRKTLGQLNCNFNQSPIQAFTTSLASLLISACYFDLVHNQLHSEMHILTYQYNLSTWVFLPVGCLPIVLNEN